MNEAVIISATSLDEQQILEQSICNQRKQLQQLKQSKDLLQNTMLDQLSAVRKQLQMERIARVSAESAITQLKREGISQSISYPKGLLDSSNMSGSLNASDGVDDSVKDFFLENSPPGIQFIKNYYVN